MSISEKLETIAENEIKVYEAGKKAEYDRFWDEFQQNGERTNYMEAFGGVCWNQELLKPKYSIKPNDGSNKTARRGHAMFRRCGRGSGERIDFSKIGVEIDFSKCLDLESVFEAASVDNIYMDASSAISIRNCFSKADSGLGPVSVTIKVTENLTNAANAFAYCNQLENLIFTEDSVIACSGFDFSPCVKLSYQSIVSIVNALSSETEGLSVRISKSALDLAFESTSGANDGSETEEWNQLKNSKPNWTIILV